MTFRNSEAQGRGAEAPALSLGETARAQSLEHPPTLAEKAGRSNLYPQGEAVSQKPAQVSLPLKTEKCISAYGVAPIRPLRLEGPLLPLSIRVIAGNAIIIRIVRLAPHSGAGRVGRNYRSTHGLVFRGILSNMRFN